jgi:hypothetical protein
MIGTNVVMIGTNVVMIGTNVVMIDTNVVMIGTNVVMIGTIVVMIGTNVVMIGTNVVMIGTNVLMIGTNVVMIGTNVVMIGPNVVMIGPNVVMIGTNATRTCGVAMSAKASAPTQARRPRALFGDTHLPDYTVSNSEDINMNLNYCDSPNTKTVLCQVCRGIGGKTPHITDICCRQKVGQDSIRGRVTC